MRATIRRETGRLAQWEDIDAGIRPYFPMGALSPPTSAGSPLSALQAQGPALAAPQAQGAPLTLNTGPSANDNRARDADPPPVRLHITGETGFRAAVVGNPQGVEVGGPLVERPQLLGALP